MDAKQIQGIPDCSHRLRRLDDYGSAEGNGTSSRWVAIGVLGGASRAVKAFGVSK